MAYDRYDRDDRSRWPGDRYDRDRGDERGFWNRASDEVASWFGDEDAERRRRRDARRDDRDRDYGGRPDERSAFGRGWGEGARDSDRGYGGDYDRDRAVHDRNQRDRDSNYDRGLFNRGGSSERDYNRDWQSEPSSRDWNENRGWDRGSNQDRDWPRGRGDDRYRPMTGDYAGVGPVSDRSAFETGGRGDRDRDYDRSQTPYGRDQYRRTSFAGSRRDEGDFDPNYWSWRDRHMGELDRDYDDYRRENQSRFENDFTSWRDKRQNKRALLDQIREHMKVVGIDEKHVGTVDRVSGDRIILTKSDPESGGSHHSLSCSDIDRIEGDKVVLDCTADEARNRWHPLGEHDDQGESGPHNLNRSFAGTYR